MLLSKIWLRPAIREVSVIAASHVWLVRVIVAGRGAISWWLAGAG